MSSPFILTASVTRAEQLVSQEGKPRSKQWAALREQSWRWSQGSRAAADPDLCLKPQCCIPPSGPCRSWDVDGGSPDTSLPSQSFLGSCCMFVPVSLSGTEPCGAGFTPWAARGACCSATGCFLARVSGRGAGAVGRQVGVVQQADTLMLPPSWLLSASISTLPTGAERPFFACCSRRFSGSQVCWVAQNGGPPKADGCTGTAARPRGATAALSCW